MDVLRELNKRIQREKTIQALRMRNEMFTGDGMNKEIFTQVYLNGLGEYEKKIAKQEGIEI